MSTEVNTFLQGLRHADVVAVDTETTGLSVSSGKDYLMGLSLAYRAGGLMFSEYFPFRHETDNLNIGVANELAYMLSAKQLVFFNAKFDMHSLMTIGWDVDKFTGQRYDALLLAHMVNEEYPRHKSLENCAQTYIGKGKVDKDKMDALTKAIGWDRISPDVMRDYARGDAEVTLELFEELWKRYVKMFGEHATPLWHTEKRAQDVLFSMEQAGVGVDLKFCRQYAAIAEMEMDEIEDDLEFTPSKTSELSKYLFDDLKLPVLNYTPGGKPSMAKADMESYDIILEQSSDVSARLVLNYRGWQKASSTFYKPFQQLVDSNNKIHCSYKQHGTVTGRLSCAEPNLQQIPRSSKNPWNGKIRSAFQAEEGYSLVGFDYSQAELRLASAYGQEQHLIEEFSKPDSDVFTALAELIEVDRYTAKTFTYGLMYGAGKEKTAKILNQPLSVIEPKYDAFLESIPGILKAKRLVESKARQRHYIRYWTGRQRHFRNPEDSYKAWNSLLQGGVGEIVKQAMIECFYAVTTNECRLLLQIHDELTFEIRTDLIDKYSEGIIGIMEEIPTKVFDLPFVVESKVWNA